MNSDYFPKTDIEYALYFNIDSIERAKCLNLERLNTLNKQYDVAWQMLCADLGEKVHRLDEILTIILSKDGIDDINTYYSFYNSALLLNRKIELAFLQDNFKKQCKKNLGNKFRNTYDSLFSVGNNLFPNGNIVRAILSHSAKFFFLAWIAGMVLCCVYLLRSDMKLLENILILALYVFGTIGSYLLANKWIVAFRKNRVQKIGFEYSYVHKPINPDFLSRVLTDAGINKLNRL